MTETDLCECDRPDEVDNPHRHPLDVACIYWIAGRPTIEARRAAAEDVGWLREALGLNIPARGGLGMTDRMTEQANYDMARAREDGIRQAITWLRADYPFGEGPDWREDGAQWIADRLADEMRSAHAGETP